MDGLSILDICDLRGITEVGYYHTDRNQRDQPYRWGFQGIALNGNLIYTSGASLSRSVKGLYILRIDDSLTIANNNIEASPTGFNLVTAYPNPFNSTTRITYSIPFASHVSLALYDLTGRKVVTLVDDNIKQGIYTINLNAADLSSGLYFVKLEDSKQIATRKLILIK